MKMKLYLLLMMLPLQIISSQNEIPPITKTNDSGVISGDFDEIEIENNKTVMRLPVSMVSDGLILKKCKEFSEYKMSIECSIDMLEKNIKENFNLKNLKYSYGKSLTISLNYHITVKGLTVFDNSYLKLDGKKITDITKIDDINNELIRVLKLTPNFEPAKFNNKTIEANGSVYNWQVLKN